ncbi:MAG: GNAT family N-acetyltransferase [Deltaproteobacteria bacterium]|nr:GNAT family N-acetyltransferase [Deltaproteobacteria bacterium]
MTYRAVLTDPAVGGDALVRIWTDNLHVAGDPRAKLRWQYADGLHRAEAFLLRDDDAPVGCAGITVRELWSGDARLRVALLADFAVDRAHRVGFPALLLQRAVKRHVDAAYDASYGFPNHNAVAVHKRSGYHELGLMGRYVRVLRHAGYLARRFRRPLVSRVAGYAADGAKLAVRVARALAPSRTLALRWLPDVDPRFDRLWQAEHATFRIACRRDAAFLRWRFLRAPGDRYRVLALVERQSERLRAYAIIRGAAGGIAELADVFGSLEAIGELMTLMPPALYGRGHTAISMRFLGDPRIPALLTHHHFSLRDALRTVIVHPGASCPIDPAMLRDPAAWYLTDLDEDI